ncbi:hypothetical protein SUGI_1133050 [Cryptomeria japonica]|nr:hypothetical protein SUGI_1133050 [Cryptomeria japonica]
MVGSNGYLCPNWSAWNGSVRWNGSLCSNRPTRFADSPQFKQGLPAPSLDFTKHRSKALSSQENCPNSRNWTIPVATAANQIPLGKGKFARAINSGRAPSLLRNRGKKGVETFDSGGAPSILWNTDIKGLEGSRNLGSPKQWKESEPLRHFPNHKSVAGLMPGNCFLQRRFASNRFGEFRKEEPSAYFEGFKSEAPHKEMAKKGHGSKLFVLLSDSINLTIPHLEEKECLKEDIIQEINTVANMDGSLQTLQVSNQVNAVQESPRFPIHASPGEPNSLNPFSCFKLLSSSLLSLENGLAKISLSSEVPNSWEDPLQSPFLSNVGLDSNTA